MMASRAKSGMEKATLCGIMWYFRKREPFANSEAMNTRADYALSAELYCFMHCLDLKKKKSLKTLCFQAFWRPRLDSNARRPA